jgi:hypothetical protein
VLVPSNVIGPGFGARNTDANAVTARGPAPDRHDNPDIKA